MTDLRRIGLGVQTFGDMLPKRERFAFLYASLVMDGVNLRID